MRPIRPSVDPRSALVGALFLVSGATGLVYEILWSRLLTTHVFGTTVYAVSTVLAAFMCGTALGAFALGRRADRLALPLRMYALLEAGVGLYAFAFPILLKGVVVVFVAAARGKDLSPALVLLRFVLAFVVLLPPSILMGATLPALARHVTRSRDRLGRYVGGLYGLNTLGAVTGTLLTGFLLVARFGVTATLFGTGATNLLIALVAWWLARDSRREPTPNADMDLDAAAAETDMRAARAAVVVVGVSGFCALAYEVIWTHVLVLFLGSTTYAFSTMLAAFLTGIALGGAAAGPVSDRTARRPQLLAYAQIAIGIGSVLVLPGLSSLYGIVRAVGFGGRPLVFVVCVLLMLLPTVLMGASFTLAARIAAASSTRLARTVGSVYASNTFGAIVGSLSAGFILIPLLGIRNAALAIAVVNVLAGAWMLRAAASTGRAEVAVPVAVGLLISVGALFLLPRTDLFTRSAIYQEQFARLGDAAKIENYSEEPEGIVTVLTDPEGSRRLYVDTNEAANDTRWDAPSHRVIAHVPLLLHPDPKRALVVGFGMGRTSNSIVQHGVEVDAAEIHPGVIRAARAYFSDANSGVLDSDKLHVHVNDGRNFILTTLNRYDMISTGIIHPLVSSGSSGIYSRDFYRLCRDILTDDGVMSQWVPLHRLPLADLKTIVRTFLDVFPETTVWFKYTPDFLILAGTKVPQSIDIRAWARRTTVPAVKQDLAADDLETFSLLDSYFMGPAAAARFADGARLHTDDKPVLEFFAPNLGGVATTQVENIEALLPFRESVYPLLTGFASPEQATAVRELLERFHETTGDLIRGQIEYAAGRYENAVAILQPAYARNPDDATIGYNLQEAARLVRRDLDAQIASTERVLLDQVRRNPEDTTALTNLGLVYRNAGRLDDAALYLERALRLQPGSVELLLLLGEVHAQAGEVAKAIDVYESASKKAPDQIVIYGSLAALYERAERIDDAIAAVQRVLRLDPDLALAHSTLGSLYLTKGDAKAAESSYRRALTSNPPSSVARVAWNGLGLALARSDRRADATSAFRKALEIDPNFAEASDNLAALEAGGAGGQAP